MMKKGTYPIVIESGGTGTAFAVSNAETLENLLFYHPSDLETELSRPGTDANGTQTKTQLVN
jgi:hypothetical protein